MVVVVVVVTAVRWKLWRCGVWWRDCHGGVLLQCCGETSQGMVMTGWTATWTAAGGRPREEEEEEEEEGRGSGKGGGGNGRGEGKKEEGGGRRKRGRAKRRKKEWKNGGMEMDSYNN